jgi:adenylate kinase
MSKSTNGIIIVLLLMCSFVGLAYAETIPDQRLIVIILGPTGVGKGTQSKLMSKAYGLPHISTGDLYREETSQDTPLCKLIKYHESISKDFIPEEIMIGMLLRRLLQDDCQKGFILDGFPRSLSRAQILERFILRPTDRTVVFILNVKDAEILWDRLNQRVLCSKCGGQYDGRFVKQNKCGKCGENLSKRPDDSTKEAIEYKLHMYGNNSQEINMFLEKLCDVHYLEVQKDTTPSMLFEKIQAVLNKVQ